MLPDRFSVTDSPIGFLRFSWQGDLLVRIEMREKLPTEWKAQQGKDAEKMLPALFPRGQWRGTFAKPVKAGFYGSDFQWAAMRAMNKVPQGQTITYGALAAKAGASGAARAAGSVCARNPLPFLIPCHRILASNGGLGGYGFGTALKLRLLDAEK